MDLLSTIQELQMVDALVQLHKWPRATADYVVRRVSHGVHATTYVPWGELDDLLQALRDQKIITAGQSIQVRNYLTSLNEKRELRRDLLGRRAACARRGPSECEHESYEDRVFPPIISVPEHCTREPEVRESEPEYCTRNPYFIAAAPG